MPANKRNGRKGGARRRNRGTNSERSVSLPNHINLKPAFTAPYKFSRTFDIGALPKGSTDLGHAFPFALSLLPNWLEFSALFDRYRINQVDVRLVYSAETTAISGGFSKRPTVWAYMDDDDASIPTSKSSVMERQSVRPFTYSDAKSVASYSIAPRWLIDSTNKASLAPRSMWIDMSTPAVSHYGLKLWIDDYNNTLMHTGQTITASATIHFECQCVR
jgi:hypothetical protein